MDKLVVFTVPQLVDCPIVGGGCCAVSSACLIEDSLGQLPGVKEVNANDENGEVRVRFDPERIDAQQIGQALQEMSFTSNFMFYGEFSDCTSHGAMRSALEAK
ncbi:MAG: heavy-metal-associated domain-containing protein [Chloroflexi bacterium]|nr:heavy-metal-associated domain-containing protein [Chloroflexota bacterium]